MAKLVYSIRKKEKFHLKFELFWICKSILKFDRLLNDFMKKLLYKFRYPLIAFAIWLSAHITYATIDGLTDHQTNADVAIVFGNKVNEDGTLSIRLQARLYQAVAIYQAKRVPAIIVSGGFGKEGFWEGDKMQEYLLSQGIPQSAIIVDNYGNDTELTVKNSLAIMQQKGWHSAISVSQFFHQTRIKMLYRKAGFTQIESSSPYFFAFGDGYSSLREFIGFYVEGLK